MIKCRKCRDMMIEALYGELSAPDKTAFEGHLGACPDCAAEYSVLGATLRVMDGRRRPDPGPDFWDGYWDRLRLRMGREESLRARASGRKARRGRLFGAVPRWAYQAAAAVALITAGILIGRSVLAPPPRVYTMRPAAPAPGADEAALRAASYIDRSEVLLLGLVNFDSGSADSYALDLPLQKRISRGLAAEAGSIQNSLTDPRQARLRRLVAELRVIMLQIANLEEGQDLEGVELVKQGVDRQSLLLRIDLSRMTGSAGSGPARPETGRAPVRRDKTKI